MDRIHSDIYVDLFGIQRFGLFNYTAQIAGDCIALGAASAPEIAAPASDTAATDTPVTDGPTQDTTASERRAIVSVLIKRDGNDDADFAYVVHGD
ncbi:MAG: hypothetical protein Q9161_006256 [Pseudevernia consocians]